MSYLIAIETANPKSSHTQAEFSAFYTRALQHDSTASRKINIISQKSGITKRHSVIEDFKLLPEQFTFFPKNHTLTPAPSISDRMRLFQTEALQLSISAVRKIKHFETIKTNITHIITVTCTGLFAPGLDIELMECLDLKPTVHRTSINFMGCNAALLALKQANYICESEKNAMVLIVCTELCTIHFQNDDSDDYILSNHLFADGCAAAIVSSSADKIADEYPVLQLKKFQSLVINEGKNEMAWRIAETGFMMNLTSYVSPLLNKHLPTLLDSIAKETDLTNVHWAVHPGGKRILDDFCKNLQLPQEKLASAYQTLSEFGNMSSPTILFVLKKLLSITAIQPNENILLTAFGPGLNIETATLSYV